MNNYRHPPLKVPEHYDPSCMIVWILKAQGHNISNRAYYVKNRKEILAKRTAKRAIK